jgi:hypothetical protein
MYCTEAVAESIVRAYSEKKISLDNLELTPLQTELKVAPVALVFLAGLVVNDDETNAKKRFTTRQQALFSKLQQIYNDSDTSSTTARRRRFTLSQAGLGNILLSNKIYISQYVIYLLSSEEKIYLLSSWWVHYLPSKQINMCHVGHEGLGSSDVHHL